MSKIAVYEVPNTDIRYIIKQGNEFVDAEKAWELLKKESWWKDAHIIRFLTAILNSRCYSVLRITEVNTEEREVKDQYEFIGMLRVITDYATFAYIDDVVIDPAYQGLGIGSVLNNFVLEDKNLAVVRRWLLIAGEKVRTFYSKFGFKEVNKDIFFELYNGEAYKHDNDKMEK